MASSSRLRIGVVCFSTFGGSGVVATEVGMALGRLGHRVCFISDKMPVRLPRTCPEVTFYAVDPIEHPLLADRSYALALAAKMIEVARAEELDLFHLHYAIPHAASAYLARQVLGTASPKIVTTLHGTDVSLVGSDPRFQPLTQLVVRHSDAITAPSRWLAEAARRELGLASDVTIDVIPNFVDAEQFRPLDVEGGCAVPGWQPGPPARADPRFQLPSRQARRGCGAHLRGRARRASVAARSGGRWPRARAHRGLGDLAGSKGSRALPGRARRSDRDLAAERCVPVAQPDRELRSGRAGSHGLRGSRGGFQRGRRVRGRCRRRNRLPGRGGDVAGMARHALRLLTDEDLRLRMARAARHLAETRFRLGPAVERYEAVYRRVL
jgi:glycosyltransferase involved in cell wall biosynthesis